jgi:hypothetical protein
VSESLFERQHRAIAAMRGRRLFFVVGMPKSGTTWIEKVLDAHPEVECRGEAHLTNSLLPVLEAALREYNRRADKRRAQFARVGLAQDTPRFDAGDLDYLFGAASALLLAKWMGDTTAKCIGEKTPDTLLEMDRLTRIFPTARFIHIIRDGRDAAVSGWKMAGRMDDRSVLDQFPDLAAYARNFGHNWTRWIERARAFGAAHPERYFELRYEQIHAEPERWIRAMYGFLGVGTTDALVAAAREATDFATLSGGRARGEGEDAAFFRKGVTGDWAAAMGAAEQAAFAETGGAMLAKLGYPAAPVAAAEVPA